MGNKFSTYPLHCVNTNQHDHHELNPSPNKRGGKNIPKRNAYLIHTTQIQSTDWTFCCKLNRYEIHTNRVRTPE